MSGRFSRLLMAQSKRKVSKFIGNYSQKARLYNRHNAVIHIDDKLCNNVHKTMQYCASNHNTLNETKQRYVYTQYALRKGLFCVIMTEGIMYEKLITFSAVIGY